MYAGKWVTFCVSRCQTSTEDGKREDSELQFELVSVKFKLFFKLLFFPLMRSL